MMSCVLSHHHQRRVVWIAFVVVILLLVVSASPTTQQQQLNVLLYSNHWYNSTCELGVAEQCNGGQFICMPVANDTLSEVSNEEKMKSFSAHWWLSYVRAWITLKDERKDKKKREMGRCLSCVSSYQCDDYPLNICKPMTLHWNGSVHAEESSSWISSSEYSLQLVGNDTRKIVVHGCSRRSLMPWTKLSWRDLGASVACFVGGALAASSGIGGGGLYVPLLLIIAGYTPQFAAALSTLMSMGLSVSGFILIMFRKHPKANRPIIDYKTALMLEPIVLCGSTLGVLLNAVLPYWSLVVITMLTLLFIAGRTVQKGIAVRKSETRKTDALMTNDPDMDFFTREDYEQQKALIYQAEEGESDRLVSTNNEQPEEDDEVSLLTRSDKRILRALHRLESTRFPVLIWIFLAIAWIAGLLPAVLRGDGHEPSEMGVKECSGLYWGLTSMPFPLLAAISIGTAIFSHIQHREKVRLGFEFQQGDVRWTLKNAVLFPLIFVCAGLSAGLLGVGAGVITGPLLLELGMLPPVAVATSSFQIFFTSSNTAAQYAFMKQLPWDFSLWYGSISLVSGLIGQYGIGSLVRKYNRFSVAIFLCSGIIAFCALSMGGVGIWRSVQDAKAGRPMGFRPLC